MTRFMFDVMFYRGHKAHCVFYDVDELRMGPSDCLWIVPGSAS